MMQLPDDTIRFLSEWVPRLRDNSFSYKNLIGQDIDPQPRRPVRSVTASAAVNPLDDLVLVSGNTTMTLESAVACDGRRHLFIKTDTGTTMTIAGTPTIDGGASIATATQYAGVMVISNGTTWNAIRLDIATSVGILAVANGGTGVAVSGTTAQIAVGGGTGSPIVWTTATGTGAPVRADAPTGTGNWTIPTINLTGGQITFPATQVPSASANVLTDYEKGTWTPTDGSGASLTFTGVNGTYLKIGDACIANSVLTYPVTASGAAAVIASYPFTVANFASNAQGLVSYSGGAGLNGSQILSNPTATSANIYTSAGAQTTNLQMSASQINAQITYRV